MTNIMEKENSHLVTEESTMSLFKVGGLVERPEAWKRQVRLARRRLIHCIFCMKGEWVNDNMHGQGTYSSEDGRIYDGEWIQNQRHGHGKFSWPNGDFYIVNLSYCVILGRVCPR